jgi:hypothetical protein
VTDALQTLVTTALDMLAGTQNAGIVPELSLKTL